MNLKDTYNKIAEDWFKDHHNDDWWKEGTDYFVSKLKLGSSVLDVGCGAGVKSKYLISKGLDVTGIDFAENFIAIAKREIPGGNFQVVDMYEVEKINKIFDGVFSQASLLHIPKRDTNEIIGKLANLLKKGGYFYIAVKGQRDNSPEEEIFKENDYGYEYERFFSYYKMEELEQYLKNWNLDVVYKNSNIVGRTQWLQIIGQK